MCGVKESMTDVTVEDSQVVIDTTSDESKSLADVPSEEAFEDANDEERTVENCPEPEGERTEPAVR